MSHVAPEMRRSLSNGKALEDLVEEPGLDGQGGHGP